MKKLLLYTLSISLLLLSACSKKSDEKPLSIVGKWYFVQSRLTETPNGEPTRTTFDNRNHTDYILLNTDNSGEYASTTYDGIESHGTFTYQYIGKSLTLTAVVGNLAKSVQVKYITTDKLTLTQPAKNSSGNVDGTYEVDYTNQ